ncbi:MAG: DUF2066 domain-containing protein [Pseudomonadota bacterium]
MTLPRFRLHLLQCASTMRPKNCPHMQRILPVGCFLILWLLALSARAELIRDMYSAQVPVDGRSASELNRAASVGLSEVLVRVSGTTNVLDDPTVAESLSDARARLQRYGYNSDPDDPTQLLVNMLFDSTYVTQVIIDAAQPLWTANRPVSLLWLVQESSIGRQYVNAETAPELVRVIKREFARRGVPVQLPLYDLADRAALSPDELWALDGPALERASERYNRDNVLGGRFAVSTTGEVNGQWTYLRKGLEETERERINRSTSVENEALFVREGVAIVAESMSSLYAVAATANETGFTLAVRGVTDFSDYAAVVGWLEQLELVDWANIESINGDTIVLRINAQVDADQLATMIQLNQRLVPIPTGVLGGQALADLMYQWQK